MAIGIGRMLVVVAVVAVMIIFSLPAIQQYGCPSYNFSNSITACSSYNNYANLVMGNTTINSTTNAITYNGGLVGTYHNNIYAPLNQTRTNSTGFGILTNANSGLSGIFDFVFGGIGTIITSIFYAPALLSSIILTVLTGLTGITAATGASYVIIINMFESLAFIYILLQAMSSWLKYNLFGE